MRSDLLAHIATDRLRHNVAALRACCADGVKFCAPLKADAYGHGVAVVAPVLAKLGVECAAVATMKEAVELRELGWQTDILVLGNVLAVDDAEERGHRIAAAVDHRVTLSIVDGAGLSAICKFAPAAPVSVQIKIDTGMGRMGVMPEDAVELVRAVVAEPHVRLTGIYSHFATADLQLRDLALQQLAKFRQLRDELAPVVGDDCIFHLANSAATLTMPESHFDMIRPGLAMYGYAGADDWRNHADLRPILRFTSHITLIKELPAGHCVGYGQTFTTQRPTRLGIVPVGYSDGFARALSNNATIETSEGPAPVIGRVSMDQLAVDLTDLNGCRLGSGVTLISDDPASTQSVESLARKLDTIPYEITCRLGARIDKIAHQSAP